MKARSLKLPLEGGTLRRLTLGGNGKHRQISLEVEGHPQVTIELEQLRLDPDGCTVSYESIDDGSVDVRFTPKEGRTVRVVRARVRAEFDADDDVFEGWAGARRWELAYIADVEIGLATIA